MHIGDLAKIVGVSVATIRYYEQEGLIEKPARSDANYRRYGSETLTRLGFIRQCRSLGISLTEIRRLLKLTGAPDANCGEVDVLLDEHIATYARSGATSPSSSGSLKRYAPIATRPDKCAAAASCGTRR